MKNLWKIVAMMLLTMGLCLASGSAFAASLEDVVPYVKVNPYGGERDAIDTIDLYQDGTVYYLFMPSDWKPEETVIYYNMPGGIKLNGTELVDGAVNPVLSGAGTYGLTMCGLTSKLVVMESADIPAVFLTTESGTLTYIHADKDHKEAADIRIYEDGKLSLDSTLKQIKGRGNATWKYSKKPYNIKFEEKTKVLGMAKAKKWTLLSCVQDESLAESNLGWKLGNALGLPYISDSRTVDLYINHDYLGTYILCESVEVGKNRIEVNDLDKANEEANPEIEDLSTLKQKGTDTSLLGLNELEPNSMKWLDIPNDPGDISGGYLLEFELSSRYGSELCGFVTYNGQPVVLKSPENATESEVRYISGIVNAAMEAVYSDTGYNSEGVYYTDYFDMDSMVNMYIIQELSANMDTCITSFFLIKPEGSSKLIFAPLWDMDNSFAKPLRYGGLSEGTDFWFTNSIYSYRQAVSVGDEIPNIFNVAYRKTDFRALVSERWSELRQEDIIEPCLTEAMADSASYEASAMMNAIRWEIFDTTDVEEALACYRDAVENVRNFVTARCVSLDKGFAADSAMLYYDANGGRGWRYQPRIASIGDSLVVLDDWNVSAILTAVNYSSCILPSSAGLVFDGWNTCADGSGMTYYPGDTITLTESTTVLYAQWEVPIVHIHQFTSHVVEPTCTTLGYKVYSCKGCGLNFKTGFVLPPGHAFGADGKCTRCGSDIANRGDLNRRLQTVLGLIPW